MLSYLLRVIDKGRGGGLYVEKMNYLTRDAADQENE
jgi:hypothetical protein